MVGHKYAFTISHLKINSGSIAGMCKQSLRITQFLDGTGIGSEMGFPHTETPFIDIRTVSFIRSFDTKSLGSNKQFIKGFAGCHNCKC